MDMKTKRRPFLGVWLLLASFCGAGGVVLFLCLTGAAGLPDTVGRPLTAGEAAEIIGRNSPLTEYVLLSPNADFPREGRVEKLTIHHMAGDLSLEALGESFSHRDRRASSNYAVDSQGRVGLYVEESNRAWTSSSPDNDHRAVTIEVANDRPEGDWRVSGAAYASLVALCADVCRRNGIEALVFTGDETGNLTLHKMFNPDTVCPGPYLESRMEDIVREVNRLLAEG